MRLLLRSWTAWDSESLKRRRPSTLDVWKGFRPLSRPRRGWCCTGGLGARGQGAAPPPPSLPPSSPPPPPPTPRFFRCPGRSVLPCKVVHLLDVLLLSLRFPLLRLHRLGPLEIPLPLEVRLGEKGGLQGDVGPLPDVGGSSGCPLVGLKLSNRSV